MAAAPSPAGLLADSWPHEGTAVHPAPGDRAHVLNVSGGGGAAGRGRGWQCQREDSGGGRRLPAGHSRSPGLVLRPQQDRAGLFEGFFVPGTR